MKSYAGAEEKWEYITHTVIDNDLIDLGGVKIKAIHTPGHTKGHTCFYIELANSSVLFTGDMLFLGGVGAFFEGTSRVVFDSI